MMWPLIPSWILSRISWKTRRLTSLIQVILWRLHKRTTSLQHLLRAISKLLRNFCAFIRTVGTSLQSKTVPQRDFTSGRRNVCSYFFVWTTQTFGICWVQPKWWWEKKNVLLSYNHNIFWNSTHVWHLHISQAACGPHRTSFISVLKDWQQDCVSSSC